MFVLPLTIYFLHLNPNKQTSLSSPGSEKGSYHLCFVLHLNYIIHTHHFRLHYAVE
jgi:hypothetical protein